ncbi:hypothetical protein J5N97_022642 [Dioscorea zingiberensis]|uniref:RING-type domain-containing protein n=1 Tax=Dioscorea zingiberensis TaxID=325984 RepID=A0A9D5HB32_9LILI|nr:hypothetical protein J5N97_022642 [Dioscorea zingiberensis]
MDVCFTSQIPLPACAICHQSYNFSKDDVKVIGSCGHFFHSFCLHEWMEKSQSISKKPACPSCQQFFCQDELIRVFPNIPNLLTLVASCPMKKGINPEEGEKSKKMVAFGEKSREMVVYGDKSREMVVHGDQISPLSLRKGKVKDDSKNKLIVYKKKDRVCGSCKKLKKYYCDFLKFQTGAYKNYDKSKKKFDKMNDLLEIMVRLKDDSDNDVVDD